MHVEEINKINYGMYRAKRGGQYNSVVTATSN